MAATLEETSMVDVEGHGVSQLWVHSRGDPQPPRRPLPPRPGQPPAPHDHRPRRPTHPQGRLPARGNPRRRADRQPSRVHRQTTWRRPRRPRGRSAASASGSTTPAPIPAARSNDSNRPRRSGSPLNHRPHHRRPAPPTRQVPSVHVLSSGRRVTVLLVSRCPESPVTLWHTPARSLCVVCGGPPRHVTPATSRRTARGQSASRPAEPVQLHRRMANANGRSGAGRRPPHGSRTQTQAVGGSREGRTSDPTSLPISGERQGTVRGTVEVMVQVGGRDALGGQRWRRGENTQ
jgi:hypothetical protein